MIERIRFALKNPSNYAAQFAADKIFEEGYIGGDNIISGRINKAIHKKKSKKEKDKLEKNGFCSLDVNLDEGKINDIKSKIKEKFKREKYNYHPEERSLPEEFEGKTFFKMISSF
jgi:hypothetical protein